MESTLALFFSTFESHRPCEYISKVQPGRSTFTEYSCRVIGDRRKMQPKSRRCRTAELFSYSTISRGRRAAAVDSTARRCRINLLRPKQPPARSFRCPVAAPPRFAAPVAAARSHFTLALAAIPASAAPRRARRSSDYFNLDTGTDARPPLRLCATTAGGLFTLVPKINGTAFRRSRRFQQVARRARRPFRLSVAGHSLGHRRAAGAAGIGDERADRPRYHRKEAGERRRRKTRGKWRTGTPLFFPPPRKDGEIALRPISRTL